jgi:GH25 family lysozyme M1 (1,4-beta-N-acetylmuramidase)
VSRSTTAVRRGARPIVVLVTALAAVAASALAYADGIDISHWQGSVSWSKVRSDGVTFAFMKATEGSYYTDPTLRTNWAGAKGQGIYRSAYHFARPSRGSAAAQARYFVSRAGTFHGKGDLPPVLDLEATGGLGPAALRSWVRTWLQTTERLTGRAPIVYCSPYFWIDHLGNSTAFTHYPLWIAHYTTGRPKVPGGWRTWTFWQRTISGSVRGIAGHVDMNRFNGSSAQLAKIANAKGGGGSQPPDPGPTVPVGKATTLTLRSRTTTLTGSATVALSGDLRATSPARALPDRALTLWRRPVGADTWRKVADDATDAAGHYSLGARVTRSADYQMRWRGGPTYAPSASRVVRLTVTRAAVAVDLHKNKVTVRRAAPLTLFGHVTSGSRGVAGLTVRYYKRFPGGRSWVYVGRSTSQAPSGRHALVVHPKVDRVWKVVVAGSDRYLPSTSAYLSVHPR